MPELEINYLLFTVYLLFKCVSVVNSLHLGLYLP